MNAVGETRVTRADEPLGNAAVTRVAGLTPPLTCDAMSIDTGSSATVTTAKGVATSVGFGVTVMFSIRVVVAPLVSEIFTVTATTSVVARDAFAC
ncbi:unannotated protein [freshwater metagenome]|uniref:Unannotated protein n=1 Tax=freshwater metagenome TaxID=449393 RepID=A0A6J6DQC1_9ZZZZ